LGLRTKKLNFLTFYFSAVLTKKNGRKEIHLSNLKFILISRFDMLKCRLAGAQRMIPQATGVAFALALVVAAGVRAMAPR
jgi:hypothetical protein